MLESHSHIVVELATDPQKMEQLIRNLTSCDVCIDAKGDSENSLTMLACLSNSLE